MQGRSPSRGAVPFSHCFSLALQQLGYAALSQQGEPTGLHDGNGMQSGNWLLEDTATQHEPSPPECTSVSIKSPSLNGHKKGKEEHRLAHLMESTVRSHLASAQVFSTIWECHLGTVVLIQLTDL